MEQVEILIDGLIVVILVSDKSNLLIFKFPKEPFLASDTKLSTFDNLKFLTFKLNTEPF